jgi:hypothetical protein
MTPREKRANWIPDSLKREWEKTHNAVPLTTHLRFEVLGLLIARLLHLKHLPPDSDDALKNLMHIRMGRLIVDDVIMRLAKLCDARKGVYSFKEVFKAEGLKFETLEKASILRQINEYCQLVANLKNHRDTRIAHSAMGARLNLRPTTEIDEAVKMAVEVSDAICREQTSYMFMEIDLRKTVLESPSQLLDHGNHDR